jgi:hypothetical protein
MAIKGAKAIDAREAALEHAPGSTEQQHGDEQRSEAK